MQSARRQATVSGDVIAAIPSSRAYGAIFGLNPAVSMGAGAALDVQVMPGMSVFGGAGGRGNEGRLQVDGLEHRRAVQRRRRVGLRARSRATRRKCRSRRPAGLAKRRSADR